MEVVRPQICSPCKHPRTTRRPGPAQLLVHRFRRVLSLFSDAPATLCTRAFSNLVTIHLSFTRQQPAQMQPSTHSPAHHRPPPPPNHHGLSQYPSSNHHQYGHGVKTEDEHYAVSDHVPSMLIALMSSVPVLPAPISFWAVLRAIPPVLAGCPRAPDRQLAQLFIGTRSFTSIEFRKGGIYRRTYPVLLLSCYLVLFCLALRIIYLLHLIPSLSFPDTFVVGFLACRTIIL